MKAKVIFPIILAAAPMFFSGCGTDAHYVQRGKEDVVSLGQINIQDYANAANASVKDLLDSGVLDKVANPPAVISISRIVNNTGQQIDQELPLLTAKISQALLQSHKAVTTSTDQATIGQLQEDTFLNGQNAGHPPDFRLSGYIIEHIDRAGNTRLVTYSFQLSLNDTKTGYQVWQGEKEIGKKGTRPAVGL